MQLRWAPAAAEDLSRIVEYIRQENAVAAQRIAKTGGWPRLTSERASGWPILAGFARVGLVFASLLFLTSLHLYLVFSFPAFCFPAGRVSIERTFFMASAKRLTRTPTRWIFR